MIASRLGAGEAVPTIAQPRKAAEAPLKRLAGGVLPPEPPGGWLGHLYATPRRLDGAALGQWIFRSFTRSSVAHTRTRFCARLADAEDREIPGCPPAT